MCPTVLSRDRLNPEFERTYSEYRGLMLALANRILQDPALAEDAVSESMVKVLEHWDCLDEPVSPRTRRFVAMVTERTALDLLRRQKRAQILPLEALPEQGSPGPDPDLRLAVREALDRLPEEQRTAVLLALTCGLTARQVSETLGCSPAKAEKLISRGKEKLRKQLREVE